MVGAFNQVSSTVCYHPPMQKYDHQKIDTPYELSLVYGKYLNLLRLPFRTVSVALSWLKILPIGDDFKSVIAIQDQFIRAFNSTLNLPRFFISQLGFYNSCTKLNKNVSDLFFSTLSLSLSSIKILQLCEKLNWFHLAKISTRIPALFAKSSNIITLVLVGRGLLNSIVVMNEQFKADYYSQTWSTDGLSPRTIKTITSVVSKSLSLIYILTTTASLYFGVYTNPVLLMGISSTSLFLNLSTNMDTYKKMIWESSPNAIADYTSMLPA